MAASSNSSSSSSSSSPPSPFDAPVMTRQQFNAFHHQDRLLYAHLVLRHRSDPTQSMRVMALWMWLEHNTHDHRIISNMLDLPEPPLASIAAETVRCLDCIERGDELTHGNYDMALIQNLTSRQIFAPKFFHERRIDIMRGLNKILRDVCVRAFEDIWKQAVALRPPMPPPGFYGHVRNPAMPMWNVVYYNIPSGPGDVGGGPNPCVFGVGVQWEVLSSEINEILSRINIGVGEDEDRNGDEKEEEVHPDERTIFVTFSKGYPISKQEVEDFFTKKFGDMIEEVNMQEVASHMAQPLYARLVLRSSDKIGVVLGGKERVKFSINGKHTWARKYVSKKTRPPVLHTPTEPASPSVVTTSKP